jgi:hypothetical protein
MSQSRFIVASLALLAACADNHPAAPAASLTARGPSFDIAPASISAVMSHLNSPRGLAWGPEGALYVAEAGSTSSTGACFAFLDGATPATKCYSGTGSISRLWKGQQERVASGLPSTFIVQNGFATGPNDISFVGRGGAYVPIGWGTDPARRVQLGEDGALTGTLLKVEPSGQWRVIADISAFEASYNPAGGPLDSNPYGVLAEGGSRFVVDAGGNSLLEVAANGKISLVATFPSTPAPAPFNQSDAVPTKIERGPDGALYVSTLSGAPFLNGSAVIYRVVPGEAPHVYRGGFKTITDFTFGPDGALYVSNKGTLSDAGEVLRIVP